jgi:hypothetical protein
MIEQTMVGGQPAVVAYLKDDFEPGTPDDYDMVKITFQDGRSMWARPKSKQPSPNGATDAFEESKVHRGGHPENKGEFSTGSGSGAAAKPAAKAESETGGATGETPAAVPLARPPRHVLIGDFGQVMPEGDLSQNVKTLDELYDKAKRDEPAFKKSLEDVAAAVGGTAMFTPAAYAEPGTTLKSRKSAERKLRDEYGGDVTQLKDILRGTVMCNTVEDIRAAAYLFMQQNQGTVARVKDRVVNPMDEGYRDIMINFRTPNGLISEIQFNTPHMLATKNGVGHRLYEIIRRLKASPHKEAHERTWEGVHQRSRVEYGKSHQAGGNGNWKGAGDERIVGDAMDNGKYKYQYKLTSPAGETFFAGVAFEPEITLYTTRGTGQWHEDDSVDPADLMFPEQGRLYDWDVERLAGIPDNAAA